MTRLRAFLVSANPVVGTFLAGGLGLVFLFNSFAARAGRMPRGGMAAWYIACAVLAFGALVPLWANAFARVDRAAFLTRLWLGVLALAGPWANVWFETPARVVATGFGTVRPPWAAGSFGIPLVVLVLMVVAGAVERVERQTHPSGSRRSV